MIKKNCTDVNSQAINLHDTLKRLALNKVNRTGAHRRTWNLANGSCIIDSQ
jgi:hypothetical protein